MIKLCQTETAPSQNDRVKNAVGEKKLLRTRSVGKLKYEYDVLFGVQKDARNL